MKAKYVHRVPFIKFAKKEEVEKEEERKGCRASSSQDKSRECTSSASASMPSMAASSWLSDQSILPAPDPFQQEQKGGEMGVCWEQQSGKKDKFRKR